MTQYAIYKGDDLRFVGSLIECAAFRGVSVNTIYFHASPSGQRVSGKRKKQDKALRIIRLEDEA